MRLPIIALACLAGAAALVTFIANFGGAEAAPPPPPPAAPKAKAAGAPTRRAWPV